MDLAYMYINEERMIFAHTDNNDNNKEKSLKGQ